MSMWPPSESEWLAIGQAITAITALFAWLQSRANAKRQALNARRQERGIQEIHVLINSGLAVRIAEIKDQSDKLLQASVEAAHAKGRAEGRAHRPDTME